MQNRLFSSRETALRQKPITIALYGCHQCGFVFNADFNPKKIRYTSEYDNTPDYSAYFIRHVKTLERRIYKKYNLKNKYVVEIGCGKGHFIKLLYELGVKLIKGFDPAYEKTDSILDSLITGETFRALPQAQRADFIICREVLEHIHSPREFVQSAIDSVKPGGVLYFEVPNLDWTVKNKVFFDFTYEHCNYFTKASLCNVFQSLGWGNIIFRYGLNGQYLQAEIQKGEGRCVEKLPDFRAIKNFIKAKEQEYKIKIASWKKFIIWGVAGKGVTFLNRLGISYKKSEYAIDINPRKHNHFVPITGQKVVGPEILPKKNIDTIVIMNPIYKKEIMALSKRFGYKGKFILPY
jgi:SAM-dependent methyltransferase